ncbi:retrovirus-related Pol polyprotein from transposon 17.6 [Trichonephila clavipes]|nr:retrovirus-related Pol polyprotein from transposon 17.6 [Trichonephila clavipes]
MVEVAPINISLTQHSPSLSVRTAISPTLTEEFIIHPSVYTEIKKISHAKSDVLLNESESSLGAYSIFTVANVNDQIDDWLQQGIIRESCSDYCSPIVLCKKKDGNLRICIDYRKINSKTDKDRYPLPLIEEVLDQLGRHIIEKVYQYEIGDIVAIQRTQFGTGLKLRPKFFGPYEVVKVKPKDRYDVRKIGLHEGPNTTSTAADHMKMSGETV